MLDALLSGRQGEMERESGLVLRKQAKWRQLCNGVNRSANGPCSKEKEPILTSCQVVDVVGNLGIL